MCVEQQGNCDAEGRLILCDCLAEAAAHQPDLLLDAATLTGAARAALGPEVPAVFSSDDAVWDALYHAGQDQVGAGGTLCTCIPCCMSHVMGR